MQTFEMFADEDRIRFSLGKIDRFYRFACRSGGRLHRGCRGFDPLTAHFFLTSRGSRRGHRAGKYGAEFDAEFFDASLRGAKLPLAEAFPGL